MAAGDKLKIVFLGPPNSGKGTQAAKLAKRLVIPAISTGEMLRAAVDSGSALGARVKNVMASGRLVDDVLISEVLEGRLDEPDARDGYLLDGYPRTAPQAETLSEILGRRGEWLDHVVLIDAPEEVLVERALQRGREDDREDVVRKRLEVYRVQTAPLIERYGAEGLLRRVDGDQTIEEVAQAIFAVVGGEAC